MAQILVIVIHISVWFLVKTGNYSAENAGGQVPRNRELYIIRRGVRFLTPRLLGDNKDAVGVIKST